MFLRVKTKPGSPNKSVQLVESVRDSSRSLTISGGGGSTSRNAFRSVASEPARTRASLRSSLAPAGENRSRKRSSC